MTEDFDESNLLDYQGYVEDEINDFKEDHDEEDESIDDESSEVGWNSEDEKKYYTKNIDKLNESYIIHEETEEELKNDELDVEMVHEEKDEELDEEIVHEEKDEELDVEMVHEEKDEEKKEELKNDELHIEIVDEEQHAWYYGIKEEIINEETIRVYESFTPQEKPLVQEKINDEDTKLHNKKGFWVIIWDFINNLFKLFSK
jgi:hypothetical protein